MKTIHIKRLRKLIAFLKALPPKKFDFTTEREIGEGPKCPTTACAIGWTPTVFPKLVKWVPESKGTFLIGSHETSYAGVAEKLFGIPISVAIPLFYPNEQHFVDTRLPKCGYKATPKQVAKMLEKFIELQTAK